MSTRHDKETQVSAEERALDELLPQWSRVQREEPPPLLDQAVLNAARREVDRGEKHPGPSRYLRWFGALATAAVVVLAVTLVVRQQAPPHQAPGPSLKKEGNASPAQSRAPQSLEAPALAPTASHDKQSEAQAPIRNAGPALRSEGTASSGSARSLRDESKSQSNAADAMQPLPPQEWIQRLLDLQAQGATREMLSELEAFRKSYPDYPLPPQLSAPQP